MHVDNSVLKGRGEFFRQYCHKAREDYKLYFAALKLGYKSIFKRFLRAALCFGYGDSLDACRLGSLKGVSADLV